MKREVDLVSYLPPFIKEYKEPVAALQAEDPEFSKAWEAVDEVLRNHFISTADEYGIARREKLLGIYPSEDASLESRRARVQNRWKDRLPYTMRVLERKLSELFGGGHHFFVWLRPDSYDLELTVYSMDDSQTEELEYLLSVMVPVNIATHIVYEGTHEGKVYCGAFFSEADIIELKQRRG